ncbi:unnamed protein product [Phytophthora lilii]|uniref:Unnamed protein product n=1 Tax=Phytophthora lilii TaxID=2077276 RepID=A0A9W6XH54_9STRA|nr:unnamed protein product [Phytophthora lilii]
MRLAVAFCKPSSTMVILSFLTNWVRGVGADVKVDHGGGLACLEQMLPELVSFQRQSLATVMTSFLAVLTDIITELDSRFGGEALGLIQLCGALSPKAN